MANILLRKGSWDTEFYHVNELSPYSMAATLRKIGAQYKVVMGKVNNDYFFVHLPTIAGPFLRRMARMIDKVLDSSFGEALVFRTPLKFILGTEIWAVVEV